MAEFGVAQGTIGRAQTMLRHEGVLYTHRGRNATTNVIDWATRLVDAGEDPAAGGVTYGDLDVEEAVAAPDVAGILGERRVFVGRRTGLAGGVPVELSSFFFDPVVARAAGLVAPRSGPGDVRLLLVEAGFPQRGFDDAVSVRQPTPAELLALDLPEGVPVVRVLRSIVSDWDRVVGVDVIVKGAHRYSERYVTRV